jgi:hypothetical protein
MIEEAGAIAAAAVLGVGLFAAGCGGKLVDAPTGSGGTGDSGFAEAGVDSGPEFCPATNCDLAPVPVSFTTAQQVYDVMAGRWLTCGGPIGSGEPSNAIGLELVSTNGRVGKVYYLVAGADGPVRGAGSAYTATYQVEGPAAIASSFNFTLITQNSSSSFWTLQYSRCPRKLYDKKQSLTFIGIP